MFDGKLFADEIVAAVRDHVARAVDPLNNKIAMLEFRLGELETRQKEFRYVGVWKADREYQIGNFVTASGALWHCEEATQSRPGVSSSWKLCVKSGSFSNDAR
jgi:hypothetical protein